MSVQFSQRTIMYKIASAIRKGYKYQLTYIMSQVGKLDRIQITVDETVKCSCQKPYCLHILCVVIWLLPDIPISHLQILGYTESNLAQCHNESYTIVCQNTGVTLRNNVTLNSETDQTQKEVPRPTMIGDCCSICTEQMTDDQELTFCKQKCRNSFHLQCLQLWLCHQPKFKRTCPLCRQKFHDEFVQDQILYRLKQKTHNVNCTGCRRKPIQGKLYRCLQCDDETYLCSSCYQHNAHQFHNEFEVKTKIKDNWECVQRVHSKIMANKYLAFQKSWQSSDDQSNLPTPPKNKRVIIDCKPSEPNIQTPEKNENGRLSSQSNRRQALQQPNVQLSGQQYIRKGLAVSARNVAQAVIAKIRLSNGKHHNSTNQ